MGSKEAETSIEKSIAIAKAIAISKYPLQLAQSWYSVSQNFD